MGWKDSPIEQADCIEDRTQSAQVSQRKTLLKNHPITTISGLSLLNSIKRTVTGNSSVTKIHSFFKTYVSICNKVMTMAQLANSLALRHICTHLPTYHHDMLNSMFKGSNAGRAYWQKLLKLCFDGRGCMNEMTLNEINGENVCTMTVGLRKTKRKRKSNVGDHNDSADNDSSDNDSSGNDSSDSDDESNQRNLKRFRSSEYQGDSQDISSVRPVF